MQKYYTGINTSLVFSWFFRRRLNESLLKSFESSEGVLTNPCFNHFKGCTRINTSIVLDPLRFELKHSLVSGEVALVPEARGAPLSRDVLLASGQLERPLPRDARASRDGGLCAAAAAPTQPDVARPVLRKYTSLLVLLKYYASMKSRFLPIP